MRSPTTVVYKARLITAMKSAVETEFIVRNGILGSAIRRVRYRPATRVTSRARLIRDDHRMHIGYEGYTSSGAENYTPANVADHPTEAFYRAPPVCRIQPADQRFIQRTSLAGKFPPRPHSFSCPYAPPTRA